MIANNVSDVILISRISNLYFMCWAIKQCIKTIANNYWVRLHTITYLAHDRWLITFINMLNICYIPLKLNKCGCMKPPCYSTIKGKTMFFNYYRAIWFLSCIIQIYSYDSFAALQNKISISDIFCLMKHSQNKRLKDL